MASFSNSSYRILHTSSQNLKIQINCRIRNPASYEARLAVLEEQKGIPQAFSTHVFGIRASSSVDYLHFLGLS